MFLVGLTGGIGSGKSTVADLFAKKNIDVYDSDQVAREVVQPGSPCLKQIQEKFGDEIIQQNGELNRRLLREKIFANKADRIWLENCLHPYIWQRLVGLAQQASSIYCILVIPLLFETNGTEQVDRILVVDVPEEVQIERASHRDKSQRDHIMQIMSEQVDRDVRLKGAHDIIHKGGSMAELDQQIEQLHRQYQKLASQKQREHRDG